MSDSLELTVVTLTCNSAATIGDCLDSLVKQSYQDFDVIVVDDDSTDETLSIVCEYSSRLRLSVTKNGSHNISRGRNIGLAAAQTDVVAFLDSDDCAGPKWAQTIVCTFREFPETALLGGQMLPGYRSDVAQAIALNDYAIRRLFLTGDLRFTAGNTALNRTVLAGALFDEHFKFAEDLELASRVGAPGAKRYHPGMVVYQHSRETFPQYARQMYRYGSMKVWFSFAVRSLRWLDFVPIALLVGGAAAAFRLGAWWPVLLNVPFAAAESVFVVCYLRCPPRIALLTFPAWLVKNAAWSTGIARGAVELALDGDARRLVRAKHPKRT